MLEGHFGFLNCILQKNLQQSRKYFQSYEMIFIEQNLNKPYLNNYSDVHNYILQP